LLPDADRAPQLKRSVRQLFVMNAKSKYLLLATVNGIFSFLVLAVIERINIHYTELQLQADAQRGPIGYILQPQPFWNLTTFAFHLGLFLVAAFILHRYFKRVESLWFWFALAFAVIGCWSLALLIGISTNALVAGSSPLEKVLEALLFRPSQRNALLSLVVVFGVNVVFGAVMQIAAKYHWRSEPRYS
jgi:hypothetical protein